MLPFALCFLWLAREGASAALPDPATQSINNNDTKHVEGTHLTPAEITAIFGPNPFSDFHKTALQVSSISDDSLPRCTTNVTSPDTADMDHAYSDFTHYWGSWCGGSEKAPVDVDGFQTIMWRQIECAGIGIHCKADAKYSCEDMAPYYNKILDGCAETFFDGEVRVSGEQDVADVGDTGMLWMKNVCPWFAPRRG